jgi:hypothetical protein
LWKAIDINNPLSKSGTGYIYIYKYNGSKVELPSYYGEPLTSRDWTDANAALSMLNDNNKSYFVIQRDMMFNKSQITPYICTGKDYNANACNIILNFERR